ncbi:hypothetical protein OAP88_00175 [Candidatus Pelagibacter sp.]|nr:hypothetical protein [Candidatus Pelagibacter sp.]|tara:strand:+ start:1027 stop:1326 length:300 start_codon:yes stop_codon:yes gene_type:complete
MKKIFLLFISFSLLTGCVQSVALLGPAFTVVKTGSIHQAFVGETINQGIKKETGKNVGEHVMKFLNKDIKDQECKNTNDNTLQKIFFNTFEDTDCKKIQ